MEAITALTIGFLFGMGSLFLLIVAYSDKLRQRLKESAEKTAMQEKIKHTRAKAANSLRMYRASGELIRDVRVRLLANSGYLVVNFLLDRDVEDLTDLEVLDELTNRLHGESEFFIGKGLCTNLADLMQCAELQLYSAEPSFDGRYYSLGYSAWGPPDGDCAMTVVTVVLNPLSNE